MRSANLPHANLSSVVFFFIFFYLSYSLLRPSLLLFLFFFYLPHGKTLIRNNLAGAGFAASVRQQNWFVTREFRALVLNVATLNSRDDPPKVSFAGRRQRDGIAKSAGANFTHDTVPSKNSGRASRPQAERNSRGPPRRHPPSLPSPLHSSFQPIAIHLRREREILHREHGPRSKLNSAATNDLADTWVSFNDVVRNDRYTFPRVRDRIINFLPAVNSSDRRLISIYTDYLSPALSPSRSSRTEYSTRERCRVITRALNGANTRDEIKLKKKKSARALMKRRAKEETTQRFGGPEQFFDPRRSPRRDYSRGTLNRTAANEDLSRLKFYPPRASREGFRCARGAVNADAGRFKEAQVSKKKKKKKKRTRQTREVITTCDAITACFLAINSRATDGGRGHESRGALYSCMLINAGAVLIVY
ncbi:hypothetical protein PUN28_005615 [Cardiocondyla obscurior]|uniref:Uncharacterized protein n=1 Tax=Cardiocondyla obscurior TaxID=286306 RepID=A0AAW2GIT6_9HYME